MKCLVLEAPGRLTLRERPVAAPEGECVVRVLVAGICGTDVQMLAGYAGFSGVPGHEFVGVVERAPAPDRSWTGKRVAGEINVGCGVCDWCAAGVKEHCSARTVVGIRGRDGAFAEYLTLPAENLHEIPAALDDETAVFVEPVAAACRILDQIDAGTGRRMAVLGDGRMGLVIAQVLRAVSDDVTVLGRHDRKLAIARLLGLATSRSDEAIRTGSRFDIVVDATGRAEGLPQALRLVRPRGTVVMKSTFHGETTMPFWPLVVDEVTIVGSRCGPFRQAIDVLASGAVQVKPLVSRIARLADHAPAFEDARRGLKVLFRVTDAAD